MDHVESARHFLEALGGPGNVIDLEPCVLRIRVQVRDPFLVDEAALRRPGVLALVRSGDVVQIVAGTSSDEIAAEMSALCGEASAPLVTSPHPAP